jgi:mxaJ protein
MCFLCRSLLLLILSSCLMAEPRVLRVCSDPNNLPFSNEAREGFENRLAEILAKDLNAKLEYTWWSERKSFVKNSLNEHRCDLLIGVPTSLDSVSVTKPYYRSTYVFVSRKDRGLGLSSLTDSRLDNLRIGIHVVGDDYAPPAHILARRGLSANIVGYSLFGKYGEPNPPARIVEAVVRGEVDTAIVWGPFAGYFAKKANAALEITPVSPAMFLAIPFTYDISAAVRKGDDALRTEIDDALARECRSIRALLSEYGIPRVEEGNPSCESSQPASASLR